MRSKDFIVEHKRGRKAKKYNIKPKSYVEPKKPKKPKAAAYGPGPGGGYGADAGYSGDGGLGESSSNENQLMQAFEDFLPLAMAELSLKKIPKIKLTKHVPNQEQPTFGRFENDSKTILLALEDRHPIDVLRTLAHELVHYKQLLQNKLDDDSGETGSPAENEANMVAGIIMRKFGKKFPNYFHRGSVDVSEASYPGNIGAMEVAKFFSIASDKEKEKVKELIKNDKQKLAWKIIQHVVGVKLQGKEFDSDF